MTVGDVSAIEHPDRSFDAVVDFGIVHQVPDWRQAVAEVARVLRPGGLLLVEEVPRHMLDTWAFAPSPTTRARAGSRQLSLPRNSPGTGCMESARR